MFDKPGIAGGKLPSDIPPALTPNIGHMMCHPNLWHHTIRLAAVLGRSSGQISTNGLMAISAHLS